MISANNLIVVVPRVIGWAVFLVFLFFSWVIPNTAVYLKAEGGLDNILGNLVALLIFTGFFVIVALEYFLRCYSESNRESAVYVLMIFCFLLPFTYYIASGASAHGTLVNLFFIYSIWACIVAFAGFVIKWKSPSIETLKFTLLFLVFGVVVLSLFSLGWSYLYGYYVFKSEITSWTFYISAGGAVIVWVLILSGFKYLNLRFRSCPP